MGSKPLFFLYYPPQNMSNPNLRILYSPKNINIKLAQNPNMPNKFDSQQKLQSWTCTRVLERALTSMCYCELVMLCLIQGTFAQLFALFKASYASLYIVKYIPYCLVQNAL